MEGDLGAGFFVEFEGGEGWLTFFVVDVELRKPLEVLQVEGQREGLFEGIEAGNVPLAVGGFAGENDVFAGVAIDIAGLFPCCGEVTQEIEFELWEFVEVVGLHGYTLYGGLHNNARGQLENISGLTGMTALIITRHPFVHDDAAPVHRGRSITAEGMEGEVKALTNGGFFPKEQVLGG